MTTISLQDIQTTDLQARVSTDNGTVSEYAEAMLAGKVFPPMVVFSDGREIWLADGFHRLHALLAVGEIRATVDLRKGTREDAMWYAVAANKTHGLRRTNGDKRKAVLKALELRPGLSSRAISEHVGVHHDTVEQCRKSQLAEFSHQLAYSANCQNSVGGIRHVTQNRTHEEQVSRNESVGGFRQLTQNSQSPALENPRPSPPPPPVRDQKPPSTPPPPPPNRTGRDGKSYQPAPKTKGPVDGIGREIPEGIMAAWSQAAAMQTHLTAISRLRGEIRRAQEGQAAIFAEVQCNLVHAELDNLFTHLSVVIPYAVCPTCQGKIPQGCRLCKERGYISEHRWKTAVPQHTKDVILKTIPK